MIPAATSPTELGPYYRPGAPFRSSIAEGVEGERLIVTGRVLAASAGAPVTAAVLDVWQADSQGRYDTALGPEERADWRPRGGNPTAADDTFRFETIRPAPYPVPGGTRPAHIHVIVSAMGTVTS